MTGCWMLQIRHRLQMFYREMLYFFQGQRRQHKQLRQAEAMLNTHGLTVRTAQGQMPGLTAQWQALVLTAPPEHQAWGCARSRETTRTG